MGLCFIFVFFFLKNISNLKACSAAGPSAAGAVRKRRSSNLSPTASFSHDAAEPPRRRFRPSMSPLAITPTRNSGRSSRASAVGVGESPAGGSRRSTTQQTPTHPVGHQSNVFASVVGNNLPIINNPSENGAELETMLRNRSASYPELPSRVSSNVNLAAGSSQTRRHSTIDPIRNQRAAAQQMPSGYWQPPPQVNWALAGVPGPFEGPPPSHYAQFYPPPFGSFAPSQERGQNTGMFVGSHGHQQQHAPAMMLPPYVALHYNDLLLSSMAVLQAAVRNAESLM